MNKRCRFFIPLFLSISLGIVAQVSETGLDTTEIPDSIYPKSNFVIPNQYERVKAYYFQKINSFKIAPLEKGDIVFLGNSITEGGGNWAKRFNNPKIKNRGISGDVTDGVIARLEEIYFYKPSAVFILIGINDLFNPDISAEYVGNNVVKIANSINAKCPDTKIFVQTILPTLHPEMVTKIQKANETIKANLDKKVAKLLNLHKVYADENDLLIKDYTSDGLHLNEEGYKLWVEALEKYVSSIQNR